MFYGGVLDKAMNLTQIKNKILFYFSVPKCVGCKSRLSIEDRALCPDCLSEYLEIKKRNCSICSHTLDACSCSNKFLKSHYIHEVIKVFRYVQRDDLPSNNLIYSLKRDNRRDVLDFLTGELGAALSNSISNLGECVFTNVPRRRKEALRYGFDHAQMLAKSLAKTFSAEYYQPLISKSKKPQKKTQGAERIKNANFKLKKNAKDLTGKTVIIVDDIITTGASMSSCAMLVRALGTKKIIGAAVSIAYKDSYVPFSTDDRFFPYKK